MTVNRQDVRDALRNAISDFGTSAQEVYRNMQGDFQGQSPIIAVESAASERKRLTQQGLRSTLFFTVHLLVIDANTELAWTEAQADDALDLLEYEFAQFMEARPRNDVWEAVDYDGRSSIAIVNVGGSIYLDEMIPVKVEVFK